MLWMGNIEITLGHAKFEGSMVCPHACFQQLMGVETWESQTEVQTCIWREVMMKTKGGREGLPRQPERMLKRGLWRKVGYFSYHENETRRHEKSRRRGRKRCRRERCHRSHVTGWRGWWRKEWLAMWSSENGRGRGIERPLDLVTEARWWPVRTKPNPEGHSLVSKGKPGGDFKFMTETLQKG